MAVIERIEFTEDSLKRELVTHINAMRERYILASLAKLVEERGLSYVGYHHVILNWSYWISLELSETGCSQEQALESKVNGRPHKLCSFPCYWSLVEELLQPHNKSGTNFMRCRQHAEWCRAPHNAIYE